MNKLNVDMSRLAFDEKKHIYSLDGVVLPSVTQILRPVTECFYSGIDPDVLQKAADRGTAIHSAIETWIDYQMDTIVVDAYRGYFNAFLTWWGDRNPVPLATELRTYHKILMYAGTVDLIAEIDGKTVLVDYKSSVSVNMKAYALQLEAYQQALKSHGIITAGKMVLHLKPDGTYEEALSGNDPTFWLTFNSLKVVHDYISI